MKLSTKLLNAALVVCADAHNLRASLAPGDLGVPTQMADAEPDQRKSTACNDNGQNEFLDRHSPDCGASKGMSQWKGTNCDGKFKIDYTCKDLPPNTSIVSRSTSCTQAYHENLEYLDRQDMACGDGEVLTQWHFVACNNDVHRGMRFDYKCAQVSVTASSAHATSCNEVDGKNIAYLDRHDVSCPSSEPFISSWKIARTTCSGSNQRVEYTCKSVAQPRFTFETAGKLMLTSAEVPETSDLGAQCKSEYGPTAQVADWSYHLLFLSTDQVHKMTVELGIPETFNEKHYFVSNGGKKFFGDTKNAYFFEDHGGNPPSGWHVYDQLGDISLGGYNGISGQVLCIEPNDTKLDHPLLIHRIV